jgi:hypothetical protein
VGAAHSGANDAVGCSVFLTKQVMQSVLLCAVSAVAVAERVVVDSKAHVVRTVVYYAFSLHL